uniref:Uncharacterized protein n=1 Tax=Pristionchus pacificus TaxID=54126 RepID=A0A2A6CK71_PRIPA|eukprot:PDM78625.1 hypothetical protein PRIPAC_31204 [Pristionchus pacificus]
MGSGDGQELLHGIEVLAPVEGQLEVEVARSNKLVNKLYLVEKLRLITQGRTKDIRYRRVQAKGDMKDVTDRIEVRNFGHGLFISHLFWPEGLCAAPRRGSTAK